LIEKVQQKIEEARRLGFEIGDVEDAIVVDMKIMRQAQIDLRGRQFVPVDAIDLENPELGLETVIAIR
jgi:hypothetical protein